MVPTVSRTGRTAKYPPRTQKKSRKAVTTAGTSFGSILCHAAEQCGEPAGPAIPVRHYQTPSEKLQAPDCAPILSAAGASRCRETPARSLAGHAQDLHRIGATGHAGEFTLGENDQIALFDVTHGAQHGQQLFVDPRGIGVGDVVGHRVHAPVKLHPPPGHFVTREGEDGDVGAHPRHPQRRAAGLGQSDDRLRVQVVGGEHHGHGDGLVHALELVAAAIPRTAARHLVGFRADADLGHRGHRLHGVLTDRSLRRQHDGIGAVHHRVGHVGHLGTRRHAVMNHGFHHLRGGYRHLVAHARQTDDLLLQPGEAGIAHLHAEVAPGHHDRVGGIDDSLEAGHRLGALDLGDEVSGATRPTQQVARLLHVVGAAHERHGQPVDAGAGGVTDVFLVLVGERRAPTSPRPAG